MCDRELGTEQRLQHKDLPSSSGHSSVSFSFSWAAQPGAWCSAICWELVLTARSRTLVQALICNCSIGGAKGPLCWVLVFSTASYLQLTIGDPGGPFCLGLFSLQHHFSNCLELPVHRVTLLFYAHSISSHNWPTEYATSAVFGMACFAGSEVNIQHTQRGLPTLLFLKITILHTICKIGTNCIYFSTFSPNHNWHVFTLFWVSTHKSRLDGHSKKLYPLGISKRRFLMLHNCCMLLYMQMSAETSYTNFNERKNTLL